jgi:hypothetical protein
MKGFLLLLTVFVFSVAFGQESSLRVRKIASSSKPIQLDSMSIYPNSLKVYCGDQLLKPDQYLLRFAGGWFELLEPCSDSVRIEFRVLPIQLSKMYKNLDTSVIYNENKGDRELFMVQAKDNYSDIFGTSGLKKNGSISRGVSFGNSQDLSINSSLNLELAGDIAPNMKILASVTDNNLPIQPDGNTNKLQEFDQVFIQLYHDNYKIIAGDFWLQKPEGYFLNYRKRAQGVYGEYSWKPAEKQVWKIQGSGAFSKGKFARQIIQGVEGNQGPYRLRGNENEPFIIILGGTERVFIDGRLLERGQEFDYVINYNTGEVIFTSRNLITKDIRIVIEFQYSDLNYARSLAQTSVQYQAEKFSFWANAYSEQDAKNQTIQQDLTLSQRQLLSEIGDSLDLARTNSIDSIGFFENQNLYKLIDSMGYDSVLVYSINPDSAYYRAIFVQVGANKGNYIQSNFNALGRVFRWVAPVNGIPQGDHEPARIIITPKQKQMVSMGAAYKIRKNLIIETEFAYTKEDLNTFSRLDSEDDVGYSNRTRLLGTIPLSKDSLQTWKLNTKVELEALNLNFQPIEQYRAVEFDRDWNTRNKNFLGNQLATTLTGDVRHAKNGNFGLEAAQFLIGSDYSGLKSRLFGKWNQKGFSATWDGSFLSSNAEGQNQFVRHKMDVSQRFNKIRIGFRDDQESNAFRINGILSPTSYEFFDYEFYLANGDSSSVNYRLFYRERIDNRSDSTQFNRVAKARNGGGELSLTSSQNQRLKVILNYRELKVDDQVSMNQTPENTLLGRVDYELKIWKGTITWNTFYEIGSGLELKREFQYIKVNDGQGIYTWIDYNGDGIKDLNEFEIAQFADQASYVRVFTPSNEYVKTYTNELNQGVFIRPERIWASKKGAKLFLSRFSNQSRVRVNRKTNIFDGVDMLNPFSNEVRDTNLISTNSNLRNTLFFNRTNSVFGAEYVVQSVSNKTLLASGFDARFTRSQQVSFRWNIKRKFTLEGNVEKGQKGVEADYTTGRNYDISYYLLKPQFSYQPNTSLRITIEYRYSNKENIEGELAIVKESGIKWRFNEAKKGSFQGAFSFLNIDFNGNPGSALGFEMLEALKPGRNFTWNAGYQRAISKSLQISIQYTGRKSETNKAIHTGGMEVRAFF